MLGRKAGEGSLAIDCPAQDLDGAVDAYFSADVETDGPIPGPFSMLSFAIVYAGTFDGTNFVRPAMRPVPMHLVKQYLMH